MKPLPIQFTSKGFNFRQVLREANVAIYERSKEGHTNPHFEVVIISEQEAAQMVRDGQTIALEAKETYPSTERWGSLGFTYNTREQANAKFHQLAPRRKGQ